MYFDANKVAELYSVRGQEPTDLLGDLELRFAYLLIKKLSSKYNINEKRVNEMFGDKITDRASATFERVVPVDPMRVENLGSYDELERRVSLQLDKFIQEKLDLLTECCADEDGAVNLEQLNQNIKIIADFLRETSGEEEAIVNKEINDIIENFLNTEVKENQEEIKESQEIPEDKHRESREFRKNGWN